LARVLLDDDPKAAADLLVTVADISQDRPVDHLMGEYHTLARAIADRDISLGRHLADRLRDWRNPPPTGITRRLRG
jgi:hypothetical protein